MTINWLNVLRGLLELLAAVGVLGIFFLLLCLPGGEY